MMCGLRNGVEQMDEPRKKDTKSKRVRWDCERLCHALSLLIADSFDMNVEPERRAWAKSELANFIRMNDVEEN